MKRSMIAIAIALAVEPTACSQRASDSTAMSADPAAFAAPAALAAATAEPNGAGDIPDTQVFVRFTGPRYSVLVPEGWSRTQQRSTVTFSSNANSESIDVGPPNARVDLRVRYHPIGNMTLKTHATLGTEPATLIMFHSQSKLDPVTGKRIELENELYTSTHHNLQARLLLSAPSGADNADQWKKIAGSFRWK